MSKYAISNPLTHPIYQIKLNLKEIKPTIWRRVQVSGNVSLHKLHKIIQVLMSWDNYHLFEFRVNNMAFGIPDEDCIMDRGLFALPFFHRDNFTIQSLFLVPWISRDQGTTGFLSQRYIASVVNGDAQFSR